MRWCSGTTAGLEGVSVGKINLAARPARRYWIGVLAEVTVAMRADSETPAVGPQDREYRVQVVPNECSGVHETGRVTGPMSGRWGEVPQWQERVPQWQRDGVECHNGRGD